MFITLSSDDCKDVYPENHGGDFTIQLAEPLYFSSRHEIALTEIAYKRSWPNITPDSHYLLIKSMKNSRMQSIRKQKNADWLQSALIAKHKEIYITYADRKEQIPVSHVKSLKILLHTIITTASTLSRGRTQLRFHPIVYSEESIRVTVVTEGETAIVLSPYLQKLLEQASPSIITGGAWEIRSRDWLMLDERIETTLHIDTLTLPKGHFDSASMLLNIFNEKYQQKYGIVMELTSDGRVSTRYTPHSEDAEEGWTLTLSPAFSRLCGYSDSQVLAGRGSEEVMITSHLQADMSRDTELLWVYTNIVKSQLVGAHMAPLLRTVPSPQEKSVTTVISFHQRQYVPLSLYHIKDIRIQICPQSNTSAVVPFESNVFITLHARTSKNE